MPPDVQFGVKIPKETFCNHAPDMRVIDLSHNQNLIFTSKPFECLEHLQCIDITGTTQNCSDAETVEWLHLQPEGRVFGNVCPSPGIQLSTSPSTQGTDILQQLRLYNFVDRDQRHTFNNLVCNL